MSEYVTDTFILRVLEMDDDALTQAFRDLNRSLAEAVSAAVERCAPGNRTRLVSAMAALDREWDVTMRLGHYGYRVLLEMPGRIIRTNGVNNTKEPGRVTWTFDGADLRDRDLPLYALAIVDRFDRASDTQLLKKQLQGDQSSVHRAPSRMNI